MPLLLVDAATSVLVGPIVDDTDFKTLETGIAYNAAGMSVTLFHETGLGEVTTVAITPTDPNAGGVDNDWTYVAQGVYRLRLTAVQNNIMGSLWVVGICDGVLVFQSAVYTVIPLKEFNVVRGADRLEVDAHEIEGADATDQLEAALATIGLDHLIKTAVDTDLPTTVHDDSVLGHLLAKAGVANFDRTADSLEGAADKRAAADYRVLAVAGYKSLVLTVVACLEQSGQVITTCTSCTVTVYDADGNEQFEISDDADDAQGVFKLTKSSPGLTAGNAYYAIVGIVYGGETYPQVVLFTAR